MNFLIPKLTHVFHATVDGGPFTLAAIVATDDLQVAFESTNHVMEKLDWRTNSNVLSTMWSTRSTMAGDYMQQGDKLFLVETRGFSHVNGSIGKAHHAVETIRKWATERRTKWNAFRNA